MENIKTLRQGQGLTQQQLAERLHVTRQTVSKWEKGLSAPDGDMLPELACALGVSLGELMGIAKPEPWHTVLKKPLFILSALLFICFAVLAAKVHADRQRFLTEPELLFIYGLLLCPGRGFFAGATAASLIHWPKRMTALGWALIAAGILALALFYLNLPGIIDVRALWKFYLMHMFPVFACIGAVLSAGIGAVTKK